MPIQNWSLVFSNPYNAPEIQTPSLHGKVFGHPKFEDGSNVTTSAVVGITEDGKIKTYSGSEYELGEVDPKYEELFPNTRERTIKAAKELNEENKV